MPATITRAADVRAVRAALRAFDATLPQCIADEIAQEAITRTLTRSPRSPVAYARRVARNLALDWLRVQRPVADDTPDLVSDDDLERRCDAAVAIAALRDAPPQHRLLLGRLLYDGLTFDDLVASEVGGSRGRVGDAAWGIGRSRLYKRRQRAVGWLRERLAA